MIRQFAFHTILSVLLGTLTAKLQASEPIVDSMFVNGFETGSPVLYPDNQVHSPLSPDMVERFLKYSDSNGVIYDDVFAKAGSSNMISGSALSCFEGSNVDLGAYADLQAGLDYFREGNAAGSTPFGRSTLAASVGRTASWVVSGDPSPLKQEFTTIWPRIVLLAFGENDMSLQNPDLFVNSLLDAADYALARGSVPVIYSTVPCTACSGGTTVVDQYRRLARAAAQYRQIPFLDLYFALDPLPGDGLAPDGVHMNTYAPAEARPCILTSEGLGYGYNMFNLVSLQMLDQLGRVLVADLPAPDSVVERRKGEGSVADPVLVTSFPYSDGRNLGPVGRDDITAYFGCSADGETEGPEIVYKLNIESTASLRVDLVSLHNADLDVWLFDGSTAGENCVMKEHKSLEALVQPGTWYLVVEAFKSENVLLSGEYVVSIDLQ